LEVQPKVKGLDELRAFVRESMMTLAQIITIICWRGQTE